MTVTSTDTGSAWSVDTSACRDDDSGERAPMHISRADDSDVVLRIGSPERGLGVKLSADDVRTLAVILVNAAGFDAGKPLAHLGTRARSSPHERIPWQPVSAGAGPHT